ncbi:MAG: hypothetical protein N4A61_16135 [Pelagimonas sp.]|jgi:hypothetical protein|nr:hypothetical protein [Pelagimonas sp.]
MQTSRLIITFACIVIGQHSLADEYHTLTPLDEIERTSVHLSYFDVRCWTLYQAILDPPGAPVLLTEDERNQLEDMGEKHKEKVRFAFSLLTPNNRYPDRVEKLTKRMEEAYRYALQTNYVRAGNPIPSGDLVDRDMAYCKSNL